MSPAPSLPAPPEPDPGWAYFLDFDGTLVDIAARPEGIIVPPMLPRLIDGMRSITGGAVALVTGRPIADLDRWLAPARFAVAGQHGLERRLNDGRTIRAAIDTTALAEATERLERFAGDDKRLIVERKPMTVALHYRLAPEREAECIAAADEILASLGSRFDLLQGKSVCELRPKGSDKGQAVRCFMSEDPVFLNHRPVFIGDDRTDEDGFRSVNELDGISILVGDRLSAARFSVPGVAAVRTWLGRLTSLA